jgi:thiamine-phosphate pyrophosphorylase
MPSGENPPPLAIAPDGSLQTMLLCYVTDRKALGSGTESAGVLTAIERAAAAGTDWVQLREKDLTAKGLLELTRRALATVPKTTRVIVNDRLDVALAAGAAGVHLAAASLPIADTVRWCRAGNAPAEFLIGASCHHLREAAEAKRAGASYIFFGPVYDTPSKASFGPPQGLARLGEVCGGVRIPVLAIGGITAENAAACFRAGAAGIAAIRLFQDAPDLATLSQTLSRIRAAI